MFFHVFHDLIVEILEVFPEMRSIQTLSISFNNGLMFFPDQ